MKTLSKTSAAVLALHSAAAIAVAPPVTKDGGVSQRFRKELIKVGSYVKPSDDLEFSITSDTLNHWAATFSQMKANGVRVPLPSTHAKADDPEANRGWLEDVFVEGDSLVGVVELVGKDALELSKKSDVSIYAPPNFTDGKGNTYQRPILHVALCTDPVIPGLGGFVPIAASRNSAPVNVPVLTLSMEATAMDWKKIQEALGITETVTDANAETLILSAATGLKKTVTETKQALELSRSESAIKKLEPVSPVLVTMAADNRRMKLDALVAAGKITPGVKDRLAKKFIGDGNTSALELSLANGTHSDFDGIVDALKENDIVKLGEQTGQQVLKLSLAPEEDAARKAETDAAKKLEEQAAIYAKSQNRKSA